MSPHAFLLNVLVGAALGSVGCQSKVPDNLARTMNEQEASSPSGQGNVSDNGEDTKKLRDSDAMALDDPTRLAKAERSLQTGDYADAKQILQGLLIHDPSDVPTLFMMAQCQAGSGDLAAAVQTLDEIPSDHPEAGFAALGQSADWLLKMGDRQAAAGKYERILQEYGDVALVHRRLAQIRNDCGERYAAYKHLLYLLDQGDVTLHELMAINCISDPFYEAKTFPESRGGRSMTDLTHAREKFINRDFPAAASIGRQLMGSFPENGEVFGFAGRVFNSQQDDASLQDWFEQLPANAQQQPEYWNALGEWLLRREDYAHATRALCESALRDPGNRATYALLAKSLLALGEDSLAEAATKRYEQLHQMAIVLWDVNSPDVKPEDFQALADSLDQLQRRKEAIMWRMIAAAKSPPLKATIPKLKSQFAELSAAGEPQSDAWKVCGVDWQKYPLPDSAGVLSTPRLPQRPAPSSLSPEQAISLVNVANQSLLHFQYLSNQNHDVDKLSMYQIIGGGVAATDYDRDGFCDLAFTQAGGTGRDGSGSSPNRLFRNLSGQRFVEISESAGTDDRGYGQGITAADLNQDGFPDLVVANIGGTRVHWNNGDGTFRSSENIVHCGPNQWSTSIACGDLDGDHLPDVVMLNYIDDPNIFTRPCFGPQAGCNPRAYAPAADTFLRMTADGALVAWQSCPDPAEMFSLGALIGNLDNELGNDVFISNDTVVNELWISSSLSEGRVLREEALPRGVAVTGLGDAPGCMGIAQGDFDRNGYLDFHVTNFVRQSSNLYLQNKAGLFFERAAQYGLHEATHPMVGFGTQAVDFDNDGWLDLAIVNGHVTNRAERGDTDPYQMIPQLFRGRMGAFELIDGSDLADPYWSTPNLGRPLASLDWNQDGRMDLVASHLDAPAALLENRTNAGDWIELELVGTTSERDAIGGRVEVVVGDESWTRWITSGDGFHCKNEALVHVGLGIASTGKNTVDEIIVTWPSGKTQKINDVGKNQRWLIIEDQAHPFPRLVAE